MRIQSDLNLYSDTAYALRNSYDLDIAYQAISTNLELSERMEVVNTRVDYSYELIEAFDEGLHDENSYRIIWIIIILIALSVVLGVAKHLYVNPLKKKSKKQIKA